MTGEMTLTYQTRLALSLEQDGILQHCARLLNTVEHSLFAAVSRGKNAASCKNQFLKEFGITARQFNACRVSLEGKVGACRAGQERAIDSLKQQITSLDQKIQHLEKKPSKQLVLHQKKRRRKLLQQRLASIEDDFKQKRIRLCFGSKKLFKAQYYLEENGFASHVEWKHAWETSRNSEFFVLGSKDESSGNQTCTASLQDNGKLCLRLRLPKDLEQKHGKYIQIPDVVFAYGHTAILAALNHPEGQALSYRFKKDAKSWKVFVSTALQKVGCLSQEGTGAIGIDLNADHIACVETDHCGNPIQSQVFSWVSYGKTREQLKAITGDLCKEIVDWAKRTKKPIVMEKLDFQKKKLTLKDEGNKKHSRLLSHFAYSLFFKFLIARAFKEGIEIHQVNPVYTSIIGHVNFAKRYGLSIHLAAALCIARRYQKFSETPSPPVGKIPDGKGGHVAFVLPVRNRIKHVWHFWGQVKRKVKTVLAAHFQAIHRSSSPPSPTPATANSS